LSIFRYIRSDSNRWHEDGIDDKFLTEIETKGNNDFEEKKIRSSKQFCYLNIATCYIKISNSQIACDACNEALKLDGSCVKALHRRSKAILLTCKCGDEQYGRAIKDLEQALKIEPQNKEVKKDYEILLKNLKSNKTKKITAKIEELHDMSESKLAEEAPVLNVLNE